MDKNISRTLLESLFINPAPIPEKTQTYLYLQDRIFPNKEDFIHFLSITDSNEKTELCRNIIQRICFESNFPPPFELLIKLLDYERNIINQAENTSYIPQDHFTHMLNTYILGVYLFFYHPTINRKLTKEFIGKRSENNTNPALNATKDFISFWKYFCFYHDIAYPIESSFDKRKIDGNEEIFLKEKLTEKDYCDFLDIFNNIFAISLREWTVEGFSRFLAVWELVDDDIYNRKIQDTFFDKTCVYTNIISSVTLSQERIIKDFKDFIGIEKIYSYEHLKMFTSFFKADEILTVLIDTFTEIPIAFKINHFNDADKRYIPEIFVMTGMRNISYDQIESILNSEDASTDLQYHVRYYFNEPKIHFESISPDNGSGIKFNNDNFKEILCQLSTREQALAKELPIKLIKFSAVCSSSDLNNYIYQHYLAALSLCKEIFIDKKPLNKYNSSSTKIEYNKEVYKNYQQEYFVKTLLDVLATKSKLNNFSDDGDLAKWKNAGYPIINDDELKIAIKNHLDASLNEKSLEMTKTEIVDTVISKLNEGIKQERTIYDTYIGLIIKVAKEISEKRVPELLLIDEKGFNCDKLIEEITENKHVACIIYQLNVALAGKGITPDTSAPITRIIKELTPQYYTYDHGIYSCMVFMYSQYLANIAIEKLYNTNTSAFGKALSTMCWNVEYARYQDKLINNYCTILSADAKSILFHNLYSSDIYRSFNTFWEIDLEKEPSTYFCMLVDALQVWNRQKYYRFNEINYWPIFSADSYNISVERGKLIIGLKSYNRDLTKAIRVFTEEKDGYL